MRNTPDDGRIQFNRRAKLWSRRSVTNRHESSPFYSYMESNFLPHREHIPCLLWIPIRETGSEKISFLLWGTCRTLNATVAQLKICQFWVSDTIDLKTIKTANNEMQLKTNSQSISKVLKWRHSWERISFTNISNTFFLLMLILHSLRDKKYISKLWGINVLLSCSSVKLFGKYSYHEGKKR